MLLHFLSALAGASLTILWIKLYRREPTLLGVWGLYYRRCPSCNIKLQYKTHDSALNSERTGKLCRSCCNRKRTPKPDPWTGYTPRSPFDWTYNCYTLSGASHRGTWYNEDV